MEHPKLIMTDSMYNKWSLEELVALRYTAKKIAKHKSDLEAMLQEIVSYLEKQKSKEAQVLAEKGKTCLTSQS